MHVFSFVVLTLKWRLTTRSAAQLVTVSLNTTCPMFATYWCWFLLTVCESMSMAATWPYFCIDHIPYKYLTLQFFFFTACCLRQEIDWSRDSVLPTERPAFVGACGASVRVYYVDIENEVTVLGSQHPITHYTRHSLLCLHIFNVFESRTTKRCVSCVAEFVGQ
jgi:hypothetical protein